ncbi:MAG: hypothetical protein EOP49_03835 [Sphingobacteriales bacterium]|nr:MAG: hypothetical protein EOP49_03835 [Sphingobacteriales bacterium]
MIAALTAEKKNYVLDVKGHQKVYRVTVTQAGESITTSCSCREDGCEHVMQVLSGYHANVLTVSLPVQQDLLTSIEYTREGRDLIFRSRARLNKNTECPLCQSGDIRHKAFVPLVFQKVMFGRDVPEYKCNNCDFKW